MSAAATAGEQLGNYPGLSRLGLSRLGSIPVSAFAVIFVAAAGWPGQALAAQGIPAQAVAAQLVGLYGAQTPAVETPAQAAAAARVPAAPPSASPWLMSQPRQVLTPDPALPALGPVQHLRRADLMVVAQQALPSSLLGKIQALPGVRAAEPVDAARVAVNGTYAAVLGVNPVRFRRFADRPTANDVSLWRSVEAGDIAVSYDMGRHDKLPRGAVADVTGNQDESLPVGGLGTVGITGVDAVVSTTVARSLGFADGNAIVISVTNSRMQALTRKIKAAAPKGAAVEQLVVPGTPAASGRAGAPSGTATPAAPVAPATGGLLTPAQDMAMLRAAVSRVGMPYIWGAAGPTAFDCSGLVQWSFARAGIVMPRVAADQALTGPAVPVSRLQPGDLLFYHTDPTAPGYISHVAIYLGGGRMIQAPEPGMDVEVVPVDLGSEFAGAIEVSPAVAARVAGG